MSHTIDTNRTPFCGREVGEISVVLDLRAAISSVNRGRLCGADWLAICVHVQAYLSLASKNRGVYKYVFTVQRAG